MNGICLESPEQNHDTSTKKSGQEDDGARMHHRGLIEDEDINLTAHVDDINGGRRNRGSTDLTAGSCYMNRKDFLCLPLLPT